MEKAQRKELLAVARPEDWLRDLLQALATIKPIWVESFRMLSHKDVIQGVLTYRDVANKLCVIVDEGHEPMHT
jgi:hypothetical protein